MCEGISGALMTLYKIETGKAGKQEQDSANTSERESESDGGMEREKQIKQTGKETKQGGKERSGMCGRGGGESKDTVWFGIAAQRTKREEKAEETWVFVQPIERQPEMSVIGQVGSGKGKRKKKHGAKKKNKVRRDAIPQEGAREDGRKKDDKINPQDTRKRSRKCIYVAH